MAFVTEDGTGLALANGYVTVAFADAYFVDRGNAIWAAVATDAEKEQAIVRATDYIDKRFGIRFKGVKQSSDQGLEWPRAGAVDNDGYVFDDVPRNLEKATCEYALQALSLTLAPNNSNAGVKITKKKVGPIETEQELSTPSTGSLVSLSSIPEYPEADLWIQELIKQSNSRTTVRG